MQCQSVNEVNTGWRNPVWGVADDRWDVSDDDDKSLDNNNNRRVVISDDEMDLESVAVKYVKMDERHTFQHNNNIQTRRPLIVTNKHPEGDHTFYGKRVVPGLNTYAKATTQGKKICIFGDSIVKTVNKKGHISKAVGITTFVKSFGGCRVDELQHYVTPTLAKNNIGAAIIHVGTNHLHANNPLNKDEQVSDIAQGIINVGLECKQGGVDNIFISSLTIQKDNQGRQKAKEINGLLEQLCIEYQFTYINNENIMIHDLWNDGIHLLNEKENEDYNIGSGKLRNNFIEALKSHT